MSSYQELMAKAREFERLAEEARKREMAEHIEEIRRKMEQAGITLDDLIRVIGKRAGRKSASKSAPKYRGPNGEMWSGGPGRKPEWVRKILAEGGNIEQYRIVA